MEVLPGGEKLHWVGGQYVEGDALRIAEAINEYDSNLRVQYLEEAASLGDPPFRVVEACRDGVERTVMYAWKLDQQLLDRIKAADLVKNPKMLDTIDKANAHLKRYEEEKFQEKLAVGSDIAASALISSKDTYSAIDPVTEKKITFRSNRPAKVEQ